MNEKKLCIVLLVESEKGLQMVVDTFYGVCKRRKQKLNASMSK